MVFRDVLGAFKDPTTSHFYRRNRGSMSRSLEKIRLTQRNLWREKKCNCKKYGDK